MDLLSAQAKSGIAAEISSLHDTFGRSIFVYKEAKTVTIVTDSSYNSYYGRRQPATTETTTISSGEFTARVRWQSPREDQAFDNQRPDIPNNICRIKAESDFVDFISGAENIVVDGKTCEIISSSRPHGLFNVDYYTYYLKEVS